MNKKRLRLILGLLFLFASGVGYYWWYAKQYPSTDNAYVGGRLIYVASQVSGKINRVFILNDQFVLAGQPLFSIETDTYDLVAAEAHTRFDSAAEAAGLGADETKTAVGLIKSETARLRTAIEAYDYATSKLNRLSAVPEGADAARDEVKKKLNEYKAIQNDLDTAFASLDLARNNITQTGAENINLRAATASLQRAELDRRRTTVTAQVTGWVSRLTSRPGNIAGAGKPLFALVEDHDRWVDANFRETDLAKIRVGQHVRIGIDMYPDLTLHGRVESLSGGSGAVFSALPPENATGNWVKVTQRFSIRVSVDDFPYSVTRPLRIGSSAWVEVDASGDDE